MQIEQIGRMFIEFVDTKTFVSAVFFTFGTIFGAVIKHRFDIKSKVKADLKTDVRRKKEAADNLKSRFDELEIAVPSLFAEMRKDLETDVLRRKIAFHMSKTGVYTASGDYLYYSAKDHGDLHGITDSLIVAGFFIITDDRSGFRGGYVTDDFVKLLFS